MIEKKNVIEYFDGWAGEWDENQIIYPEIIRTILDNAGVGKGQRVLDVACGTGVMIPYYQERGATEIVGVDISPEMLKVAKAKFECNGVSFFCMDAENEVPDGKFDAVIVYNAFPHFPNPEKLIENLASVLSEGGSLTVAHGMSQSKINEHHSGSARFVSEGLMDADVLASIFARHLRVTQVISNDRMYQVTGIK